MKMIMEVTRKPYTYDDTASPSENAYMESHYFSTYGELSAVRNEFSRINKSLNVGLQLKDYIDSFVIIGDIPEDVLAMFEEILNRYINDDFDKFDYRVMEDVQI